VEPKDLPLLGTPERTPELAAFEAELSKRKATAEKFREEHRDGLSKGNRKVRDELRGLQKKVDQWQVTARGAPPRAMVLNDAAAPVEPHVLLRGNPRNRGPAVPR